MIIYANKDIKVWKKFSNYFKKINLFDIYFDYQFNICHIDKSSELLAFCYRDKESYFFLPFIRNKIKYLKGYYDLESINGYSGPLTNDKSNIFLNKCWDQFRIDLKKNNVVCGLIRFHPFLKNHVFLKDRSDIKINKIKKTLFIDYSHNYKINYTKNVYRNLKKSSKNNLKTINNNNNKYFEIFYKLYNESMIKKDADRRFFFSKNYFQHLSNRINDNVTLILAKKEDKYIGGIIGLHSKNFCHVHLSAFNKQGLETGAPYLLRSELIDFYSSSKKFIHFGGGITNSESDSLYLFKKNFSQNVYDFYIGKIIIDKDKYENILKKWNNKYPNKKMMYSKFFLKYKY